ncbi:MAG: hypothetical protein AAFX87_09785 [Bacteroidota bacterium]
MGSAFIISALLKITIVLAGLALTAFNVYKWISQKNDQRLKKAFLFFFGTAALLILISISEFAVISATQ